MPPTEPDAPEPVTSAPFAEGVAAPEAPAGDSAPQPGRVASATGKRPRRTRWIIECIAIVVVAVLIAVLLRAFVVQTFYIPSQSMTPTLQIGDRILVNKLSYKLHGVGRGDIIVFGRPPLEEQTCSPPPVNDLVKRVIGLPGETVSLDHGHVDINGKRLSEPWLPPGVLTTPGPGNTAFNLSHPFVVPKGDYYLMGDNRSESCDSRYWGPIPKSLIVGKVAMRIWPISRIRFFF